MSLITKIPKPEEFTADSITELLCAGIGYAETPPSARASIHAMATYALEQLELRGIIGGKPLTILIPMHFNSTTIAVLMWEQSAGPDAWSYGTEMARQITIDQAQYVLDALSQKGIIG